MKSLRLVYAVMLAAMLLFGAVGVALAAGTNPPTPYANCTGNEAAGFQDIQYYAVGSQGQIVADASSTDCGQR